MIPLTLGGFRKPFLVSVRFLSWAKNNKNMKIKSLRQIVNDIDGHMHKSMPMVEGASYPFFGLLSVLGGVVGFTVGSKTVVNYMVLHDQNSILAYALGTLLTLSGAGVGAVVGGYIGYGIDEVDRKSWHE